MAVSIPRVFFSKVVDERVKEIESGKHFPVLPSDSCFGMSEEDQDGGDCLYWLQDRYSIFDRMLIDLVWRLSDQRVDGIAIVDRQEVPEGLESPNYPFDVAIVSEEKMVFFSHEPQNSSYLHDWPASLDEDSASLLVEVSDAIHRAIPVVSLEDFVKEGHLVGMIDWIGQDGDAVVFRAQMIDSEHGAVIWRRVYCKGLFSGIMDTPISFFGISKSESSGIWTFRTTEDDFQIYPPSVLKKKEESLPREESGDKHGV